jgi:hypothetical protein
MTSDKEILLLPSMVSFCEMTFGPSFQDLYYSCYSQNHLLFMIFIILVIVSSICFLQNFTENIHYYTTDCRVSSCVSDIAIIGKVITFMR